ncbi:hypothetical protein ACFC0C_26860 [Streptomyces sp. NPDC056178]|uniref:hypothetical protein n=1 Tax=Streptomyces sp. NPDC056178 TaxID=3345735 RepID=UPI0035E2133A
MPLGVGCAVVFLPSIRLFSPQAVAYSATSAAYAPARRATAPGGLTALGRTGAVVGPWLGGAVVEGRDAGLGFTTVAVTGVLSSAAIRLVPIARRARRGPAAQQASAPSGAID